MLTRRRLLTLLPAAGLLLTAGCGFRLRGAQSARLPYASLHIALPDTADVRIWLERYIQATGSTELTDDPLAAEAIFQQLADQRNKTILSVNAQGRVREYRLQLIYSFRVITPQGQVLVAPNEVSLTRDIAFDDSNVLAKDLEESLLWRDMTSDLVNQVMRRLAIIRPKAPRGDDED
jgi:LPS-assembly lipoprotein